MRDIVYIAIIVILATLFVLFVGEPNLMGAIIDNMKCTPRPEAWPQYQPKQMEVSDETNKEHGARPRMDKTWLEDPAG